MAAFDNLPPLSPFAMVCIVGLLIVFWVWMKVKLLRDRIAIRAEEGEGPPDAPAWQLRLAAAPNTGLILGLTALALLCFLAAQLLPVE